MKSKKPRRPLPPLCAVPGEDDGVAPETYFDPKRTRKDDRKTRQLCAQVARTLATMLGGELGDPTLEGTRVLSVEPAPDGAVLAVTVTGPRADQAVERLEAAAGRLRTAVAESIHRKRAPELRFRWAPETDPEVVP